MPDQSWVLRAISTRAGAEAEPQSGPRSGPTLADHLGLGWLRRKGRRPSGPVPAELVRTTRVSVRHVDPWSVLKVSLVVFVSLWLVLVIAGVLLWWAGRLVGMIGNIESFLDDIGFSGFRFDDAQLFRGSTVGGLILVVVGTVASALGAVLYNLIADVIGGVKVVLAEEDVRPAPLSEEIGQ